MNASANATTRKLFDPRAIRTALYAGCTGLTELRIFRPGPLTGQSPSQVFHAVTDTAAWWNVVEAQRTRKQLVWGLCTRRTKNGTAEACLEVPALWADLDFKDTPEAEARARLTAFGEDHEAPASLVIHSGHGVHAYWFLDAPFVLVTPEDRARITGLLKGLATALGSDTSVTDLARCLRVPGSVNRKATPPQDVVVEYCNANARYALGELADALTEAGVDLTPATPPTWHVPSGPSTTPADLKARRVDAYVATCEPAIAGQHGDLQTFQVCCRVARGFDLTDDEAFDALRAWNSRCAPPWKEHELLKKIQYARKNGKEPIGGRLDTPPPRTLTLAAGHRSQGAAATVTTMAPAAPAPPPAAVAPLVVITHDTPVAVATPPKQAPAPEPTPRPTEPGDGDGFIRSKKGIVASDPDNVALALARLNIFPTYDAFQGVTCLNGEPIDDDAPDVIWGRIHEAFHFRPGIELLRRVITIEAHRHERHPVRDYLNGLRWDGTPRLDRWLMTYASAEDDKSGYVRAVSPLPLLAAVRRVRQPGAKFDELLVLECATQGTNKSTALEALCPQDDWFSDNMQLGLGSKETIECTAGRWIVEIQELHGNEKESNQLKGFLSHRKDGPARMSYGRYAIVRPRQYVMIATTNELSGYLKDPTGSRRFWPLRVERFDVDALRRDRDQLWAEAAAREAQGESIRLDPKYWAAAAKQQDARRAVDPWEEVLASLLDPLEKGDEATYPESVSVSDVWDLLGIAANARDNRHAGRVNKIMQRFGFEKGRTSGLRSWVRLKKENGPAHDKQ